MKNIFFLNKNNKIILAIIFSTIYFLIALLTLKNYNISWDEPTHFKRGQAYLHYFITGNLSFDDLPKYDLTKARSDVNYHARSLYQENGYDGQYHLEKDGDHPPLNDILASFTNYIFYQKLGIMGDVESYHLFEIFVVSVLVGYIFIFGYEAYGLWTGVFSVLFLATYPLLLGESHFNIKDPIETAFFSISIYYVWKSVKFLNVKYLLASSIFVGLALGTKLNIIFLPLIILPWLLLLSIIDKEKRKFILSKKFIICFVLVPIIAFIIFVYTWPWLRQDVFNNTLKVLGYYKNIGTEGSLSKFSALLKWNTYPLKWVFYSTQPIVLLFLASIVIFSKKLRDNNLTIILLLLWLIVPIARVIIPTSSIYGGIRQIMEYIPSLALISGIGADKIMEKINSNFKKLLFSAVVSIILLFPIIKLHPNENVYLNKFIGGLGGAMASGFPSAGFSFGNAYLQGLHWINRNVEDGAKLALVQGTVLNIPAYKIRSDINYSNAHWSGIDRKGEYLIELTYNYELKAFPYAWEYVEKMLEPVYVVKADNTPILTIWKNDKDHTKDSYKKDESIYYKSKKIATNKNSIFIELPEQISLTKIYVYFDILNKCSIKSGGFIETSLDNKNWIVEKDRISDEQISGIKSIDNGRMVFYFAVRDAKYIKITVDANSCILKSHNVVLYELKI